ncbi:hypothetical protein NE237_017008 [Protea cynaroides]|uniref:Uncharacterized protein n=1 Tax=Protea cynaroides TaxID=273540 RepID=A0A9Q0QML6_9MAGN|nr:hypothetical protein NE237_017008 [Protea cynaroides]
MDEHELLPGSLGTSSSLWLRLGLTIFSSSLDVEFYSYTAFYLSQIPYLLFLADIRVITFDLIILLCFMSTEQFLFVDVAFTASYARHRLLDLDPQEFNQMPEMNIVSGNSRIHAMSNPIYAEGP